MPNSQEKITNIDVSKSAFNSTIDTLENLYTNSYKQLVAFASLFVSPLQTAEELLQDVFVETVSRALSNSNFQIDNPSSYVKQAIVNKSQGYHRRNFLKVVKEKEANSDNISTYEDIIFSNDRYEEINNAIENLSPSQKECVMLRFYEDMKVSEIALALNISEGTVKSHLNRATSSIRISLSEDDAKDAK